MTDESDNKSHRERQIADELRLLGSEYEPDWGSIRMRVEHAQNSMRGGELLDRGGKKTRLALVLLTTVAVMIIVTGVVAVLHLNPSTQAPNPSQPVPTSVSRSVTSKEPAPKLNTGGSTSGARAYPAASGSPRAALGASPQARSIPSSEKPTTVSTKARSVPVVAVSPVAGEVKVNLAVPPLLDWVAVGARADLVQVRAKAAAPTLLVVQQPDSARSVPGPFRVTWSGGLPEQTHDAASAWLMVAGGRMDVSVAASDTARTVRLYAGVVDMKGQVSVSGPGLASVVTAVGSNSSTLQAVMITIRLPPTQGMTTVQISGTAIGADPAVYLAAVTLTSP